MIPPPSKESATPEVSLLASLVGAFLGPDVTPACGASARAAAGLFWVSGSIATNDVFERSSMHRWPINGGYHAVRFTLTGLAFGLLG